jgi:hypothetical protein
MHLQCPQPRVVGRVDKQHRRGGMLGGEQGESVDRLVAGHEADVTVGDLAAAAAHRGGGDLVPEQNESVGLRSCWSTRTTSRSCLAARPTGDVA